MSKPGKIAICASVYLSVMLASFEGMAIGTDVYWDEGHLKVRLNGEGDSEGLYEALNVQTEEDQSGYFKRFTTTDEVVEIYCRESLLPAEPQYDCMISVNTESPSLKFPEK